MAEVGRERETGASLRPLTGLAAAAVVVAGLHFAAPILIPISLALFLAVLTAPLMRALRVRGVPVGLAVVVNFLLLFAAFAAFWMLLLGSLGELRETGPHYLQILRERLAYTVEWWSEKGISVLDWVPSRFRDPETLGELAGGTLSGAARLVSGGTVVLLTLFFMLFEAAVLDRRLARVPPRIRDAFTHFGRVSEELQRYLVIKTTMALAIGVSVALWVAFLGVDFAVLSGLLAFAFHFIPNVGAVLAAAPAMLVASVQFDPAKGLAVGAGYLVVGLGLGNLLEPALMGRRLNLSPLAVFLSLVVWGWVWGPIGMFLSVPLTMGIKILLEHSASWSWLARLLDDAEASRPAAEPEPGTSVGSET